MIQFLKRLFTSSVPLEPAPPAMGTCFADRRDLIIKAWLAEGKPKPISKAVAMSKSDILRAIAEDEQELADMDGAIAGIRDDQKEIKDRIRDLHRQLKVIVDADRRQVARASKR